MTPTGVTPAARLFVAAWPPAHLAARLAALVPSDDPGLRPVPVDQLHVTLRFLGRADIDAVLAVLSAAQLPAATAVLGPATVVLGRDAIVLPVSGLDELAAVVSSATGAAADRRPFRGHLTIARVRRRGRISAVATTFSDTFAVREVGLVQSDLRPDGAVHTVLGMFATV